MQALVKALEVADKRLSLIHNTKVCNSGKYLWNGNLRSYLDFKYGDWIKHGKKLKGYRADL
jgi:hypothetical protein